MHITRLIAAALLCSALAPNASGAELYFGADLSFAGQMTGLRCALSR